MVSIAPDERRHPGDQKTPQVLVAHFGDPTEALLASAGVVQRCEAQPSRELTAGAELGGIGEADERGGFAGVALVAPEVRMSP